MLIISGRISIIREEDYSAGPSTSVAKEILTGKLSIHILVLIACN